MTYPLPAIEGVVIMRNTYYDPAALRATIQWAQDKLAAGACTVWERRYLQTQIERIETALRTGRAA